MPKPKISVVIPAYNEEKYLPACLASLKQQTFKDFEVIVVDNNSTDKTARIAKSFGAKVVEEKRQGIAFARDRGFSIARGEIITRTDADTILPINWLLQIIQIFHHNPQTAGVAGTTIYSDLSPFFTTIFQYCSNSWFYLHRILAGHYQFAGSNFAVRRNIIMRISPCTTNLFLHEDMDFSCHATQLGKIIFDPSLVVFNSARYFKTKTFTTVLRYIIMGIYTLATHGHPFVRNHQRF